MKPCGHPCVGFCGEECPPYCGQCHPEKLLEGVLSGSTSVEPEDRFIYLPECGHCIESTAMESWVRVNSTSADQIVPIRCPICRTRITWMHRYSEQFDKNYKIIKAIREKIFGSREEIKAALEQVKRKIISLRPAKPFLQKLPKRIQNRVRCPIATAPLLPNHRVVFPVKMCFI